MMRIKGKYLTLLIVLVVFCSSCNKAEKFDNTNMPTSTEVKETYITETPVSTKSENTYIKETSIQTESEKVNVIGTSTKKEETYVTKTLTPTIAEKMRITELKCNNGDMFEEIEQFVMISSEPFILSNGKAYVLREENWTEYISDDNLIELYKGENFCALNDNGQIIVADELEKIRELDEDTLKALSEEGVRGNWGQGMEHYLHMLKA